LSLLAFPATAAAHARFHMTARTLAPGTNVTLSGAGLRPGATARVQLVIGTSRLPVATAHASRSGRVRIVIRYTAAIAAAASSRVGVVPATVVVRGQRLPLGVRGTVLDPITLAVVPNGPVGYDDDLTLRVAGVGVTGPPVSLRFADCEGGGHVVAIPRPAVAGPQQVVLHAHVGPRLAIDTSCFADLGLEDAPIKFTAGETVSGAFHGVATATAVFLPPTGI
jgi:hypothetical protein